MNKKDIKIVKKKDSFGSTIEYHYKNDKLVEKIDYSSSNPKVWKYDSNGNAIGLTVIEKKSHKKLWLGIIGSLVILSVLYATYKVHHSSKQLNTTSQHTR